MSRRGKMAAAGDDDEPSDAPPPYRGPDTGLGAFDHGMATYWTRSVTVSVNPVVLLDLIRAHAPRAFEWLVLNDTLASGIAVRRDWARPAMRPEPDAEEIAYVTGLCASLAASAADGGERDRPALREPPAPTRRQLALLLETWRRYATPENGGLVRVALLTQQIEAMDAQARAAEATPDPEQEPAPAPTQEEDEAPWIPSSLAA